MTPETTTPDEPAGTSTTGATAEPTAARVRWIRAHSGLTWRQLGLMFGVSRHAVHMWANGGRVTPTNASRLAHLHDIIEGFELDFILCGMPDAELPEQMQDAAMVDLVRARLAMQEDPDAIGGTSVIERFRRESSPSGPTWGAPFSPEELIGARH